MLKKSTTGAFKPFSNTAIQVTAEADDLIGNKLILKS